MPALNIINSCYHHNEKKNTYGEGLAHRIT